MEGISWPYAGDDSATEMSIQHFIFFPIYILQCNTLTRNTKTNKEVIFGL